MAVKVSEKPPKSSELDRRTLIESLLAIYALGAGAVSLRPVKAAEVQQQAVIDVKYDRSKIIETVRNRLSPEGREIFDAFEHSNNGFLDSKLKEHKLDYFEFSAVYRGKSMDSRIMHILILGRGGTEDATVSNGREDITFKGKIFAQIDMNLDSLVGDEGKAQFDAALKDDVWGAVGIERTYNGLLSRGTFSEKVIVFPLRQVIVMDRTLWKEDSTKSRFGSDMSKIGNDVGSSPQVIAGWYDVPPNKLEGDKPAVSGIVLKPLRLIVGSTSS